MCTQKLIKGITLLLGIMIITAFMMKSNTAKAYVMPAQQIIEFLSNNFIKINSAELFLSIRQAEDRSEEMEKIHNERLFLKSPNLYYFRDTESESQYENPKDISFFQLLVSNKKESLKILFSNMGINLEEVAFTRIDDIIAYSIGEDSEDRPKILIEKERFLPILLSYRSYNGYNGNMVSVRFNDYRKLGQIWYPYEIIVYMDGCLLKTYNIHSITVNVQTDINLLQPMITNKFVDEEPRENIEEERLKKIIKAFEEKYQQE
jgi:hypothetical protein